MMLLEIKNIDVNIDKKPILHNISFSLKHGETLAILGHSGSGKSTLLNTIAGFIQPHQGEIICDGATISSAHQNVRPEKRQFSMVWQEAIFLSHWTVEKNLKFVLKDTKDKAEAQQKIQNILNMVNLTGMNKRRPYTMSGGEKQRLDFARALLVEPKLLLLDEPFSSLDIGLRKNIMQTFLKVIRDTRLSTIIVTHSYDEALALADNILVLHEGQTVEKVSCAECPFIISKTQYLKAIIGM